jgi:protein O-mannosyl-transferase
MKKESLKKGNLKNKTAKKIPAVKEETGNKTYYLFGLAIIILLGIIIYSNSFKCSFQFDDEASIFNNASIRNLSDVKAWWNSYPSRPFSILTFAINYHFDKLNVWGYHLVNLVIHLINACLVWWLTLLIFLTPSMKDKEIVRDRKVIALFTALLFLSHPLATQSVTYIVQRMASMVAMFYLLSLALYVYGRLLNKSNITKYLLFTGSLISAILAMLTKENAFTLPLAIVLFEIFFLRTRKFVIKFKDYRVILLLAVSLSLIILLFIMFSGSILATLPPSGGYTYNLTALNYLFTQFSVIVKYLQLLILPIHQNLDYDYPISYNLFEMRTLLCLLLLLSSIVLAIYLFRKNRIISFAIFWFFLTLSIESSFIPIRDVIFEHRTYLPSFGFFLILSTSIYLLLWKKYKYFAISVLMIIIISNSFLTFERNKVWKDPSTLWSDVILKSPHKNRGWRNRGNFYRDLAIKYEAQQNNILAKKMTDLAFNDYSQLVELLPEATAYVSRGRIYFKRNDFNKAYEDFTSAIKLNPKYAEAFSNRAAVLYNIGEWQKAISDYSKAIEMDSNYIDIFTNRGNAYENLKEWEKAIADYTQAIKISPKNDIIYYNRGIAYEKINQIDKAYDDFSKAIEINPKSFTSFVSRGYINWKHNQYDKAISDFSKAIEINPKLTTAYYNRGVVYAKLSQWNMAIDDYSKVIELDPNFKDAYSSRDIAYKKLNNGKK